MKMLYKIIIGHFTRHPLEKENQTEDYMTALKTNRTVFGFRIHMKIGSKSVARLL